ncbi:MAG: TIGR03000 domain-containing protein [Gemmataceae bacterium]
MTVQLPADAKMYIDDQLANLSTGTRTFRTPELERNRDYYYDIKVEAVRDGQTVSDSKRVVVRAGQQARVRFDDPQATTVSRPSGEATAVVSQVTVQVPADAKLLVNGVASPQTSATRVFNTPQLEKGKKYAYTFQAEVERNGQKLTANRHVEFVAGQAVNVDLSNLGQAQIASR